MVLGREAQLRSHRRVHSNKHNEDRHAPRDGDHMVLGPVVGHQRGLAEDSQENSAVHGRAPEPVTRRHTITLDTVVGPEQAPTNVQDEGVISRGQDPGGKDLDLEEGVLLPETVELRIPIEETSRHELVEDT